jgi:hypothetical protein
MDFLRGFFNSFYDEFISKYVSNQMEYFWGTLDLVVSSVIDFNLKQCVKFARGFLGKTNGK